MKAEQIPVDLLSLQNHESKVYFLFESCCLEYTVMATENELRLECLNLLLFLCFVHISQILSELPWSILVDSSESHCWALCSCRYLDRHHLL